MKRFYKLRRGYLVVLFTLALILNLGITASAGNSRPDAWAKPVPAVAGLRNLYRVDSTLYRSAQPDRKGFAFLSRKISLWNGDSPVRTVLSLRILDFDRAKLPAASPLRLEEISFKGLPIHPEKEDVIKFLRIVTTPSMQPVLVHCQYGSDRTGVMVAIYRVAVDGWSKKNAIKEMINGGYGLHGIYRKRLTDFIMGLDVAAIKKEVAQQGQWK